jgi:hypothetical protein
MANLNIGIEIRDFDLERMGFSFSVFDQSKQGMTSEAYLRMTLTELNTFLAALKAAQGEIEVATVDSAGVNKLPNLKLSRDREDAASGHATKKMAAAR